MGNERKQAKVLSAAERTGGNPGWQAAGSDSGLCPFRDTQLYLFPKAKP